MRKELVDEIACALTYSSNLWLSCVPILPPNLSFQEWLRANVKAEFKYRNMDWNILFPYLCYEIWKDRNECSFRGSRPAHTNIVIHRASMQARNRIQALKVKESPPTVTQRLPSHDSCSHI